MGYMVIAGAIIFFFIVGVVIYDKKASKKN